MCGIAGIYSEQRANDFDLDRLLPLLHHRGPDSQGTYQSRTYCAGMRRLSINDLDTGDQPLYNEDHSIVLLYNGEIYNTQSLRKELESKGHHFSTHSDGEVICHLYEEYGIKGIEQLDGMYAASLWDEKKQELYLFRDHAGEKPLYYTISENAEIIFASEINLLAQSGLVKTELSPQAIWNFFTFLWIPQPESIYKNIASLMPGHYIRANKEGINIHSYEGPQPQFDSHAVLESIERTLNESIQLRMLSDVPVGGFLSGGLDSSIVMTIASKERANMTAFTVGLEDVDDGYGASADEAPQAAFLAKQLGLKHEVVRINAASAKAMLKDFVQYADQPFAVSSGLGIMAVAKKAASMGIKVLLSGDGADECFGGYSWYAHLDALEKTEDGSGNYTAFQHSKLPLGEKLEALRAMPPAMRVCAWHYYASEEDKAALLNPDFFSECTPSWKRFESFKATDDWEPMDYIRQDRECYLSNEMMVKLDRMMMAHSIEGRSPFTSPKILKLVKELQFDDCVKNGELKWSLREAYKKILDPSITQRRKHGFNIPVDHWLKNEWADLLEHTCSPASALSKMGMLAPNVREEAFKMRDDSTRSNGHILFCLITLNLWLENTYKHHGNHS